MSGAPTPVRIARVDPAGRRVGGVLGRLREGLHAVQHPPRYDRDHGAVAARTAEARRVVETYERAVREGRERIPPEPPSRGGG